MEAPITLSEMSARSDSGRDDRPACRFCGSRLELTVVDLGMSPLCESFLRADQIRAMERFYPLCVFACERVMRTVTYLPKTAAMGIFQLARHPLPRV